MRKQVNTHAGYFIYRALEETDDLTVTELQAAFNNDTEELRRLINSITHFAGSLCGTCSFWAGRQRELTVYMQNMALLHLFITLSTADYY
jgi:hypothetical protein